MTNIFQRGWNHQPVAVLGAIAINNSPFSEDLYGINSGVAIATSKVWCIEKNGADWCKMLKLFFWCKLMFLKSYWWVVSFDFQTHQCYKMWMDTNASWTQENYETSMILWSFHTLVIHSTHLSAGPQQIPSLWHSIHL